jgi:hypothetical protein
MMFSSAPEIWLREDRPIQSAVKFFQDFSVALAAGRLETHTINNRNQSPMILDQTLILQRSQNLGHTGPAHAQHDCQEFVR